MKEETTINPLARIVGKNITAAAVDLGWTFSQLARDMDVREEGLWNGCLIMGSTPMKTGYCLFREASGEKCLGLTQACETRSKKQSASQRITD